MSRHRLRLDVATVRDLPARVVAEFGPYAEIVGAERVTVGGIGGLRALFGREVAGREHFEVEVVVPDTPSEGVHTFSPSARSGIEALLDDADAAEARIQIRDSGVGDAVSTSSSAFDALLESLVAERKPAIDRPRRRDSTTETGVPPRFEDAAAATTSPLPPTPHSPIGLTAPAFLTRPGDLIVVVGLDDDPLRQAKGIASTVQAAVRVGGAIQHGVARVDDRMSATAARAEGVISGRAMVIAFGLGGSVSGVGPVAAGLRGMAPDQVWVVVDARRKEEDTKAWVDAVRAIVPVAGAVVIGADGTSSPESVERLGLALKPGRPTVS